MSNITIAWGILPPGLQILLLISFLVLTALCILITWQLCKHRYNVFWLSFATQKARNRYKESEKRSALLLQEKSQDSHTIAELRGRIAMASNCLQPSEPLQLVEQKEGR